MRLPSTKSTGTSYDVYYLTLSVLNEKVLATVNKDKDLLLSKVWDRGYFVSIRSPYNQSKCFINRFIIKL